MKKLAVIALLLLCGAAAPAATKVFMTDTAAATGLGAIWSTGYTGYGCFSGTVEARRRVASSSAGSSAVSYTRAVTSTAPPCAAAGASNLFYFFTAPLSSGVTISGNIDFNISCNESATALNAGMRMTVYRWSALIGGIDATIITSANTTECNNTRLAIAAAAPTSTTLAAGDRLVFLVEVRNVGGAWGGNGSRTATLIVNAASGSLGDTFANFTETISFASDSNNGRTIISKDWNDNHTGNEQDSNESKDLGSGSFAFAVGSDATRRRHKRICKR